MGRYVGIDVLDTGDGMTGLDSSVKGSAAEHVDVVGHASGGNAECHSGSEQAGVGVDCCCDVGVCEDSAV